MRARALVLSISIVASGCTHEESATDDIPDTTPVGCAAGELERDDGGCQPAGVPPERCAVGFEPDNGGCRPILPEAPCGDGLMAVPGETMCRPVAPCGEGTWGAIPVDGTTQHVDGSYAGTDNDGSAQRPWRTIQDAMATAAPGAIVAVAAGSYPETVVLTGKPVRLWGRCPELVEVTGLPDDAGVIVNAGASGSEIHDLAVAGASRGISVQATVTLLLSRLWVHDTVGDVGVVVIDTQQQSDVLVQGALIERAAAFGFAMSGGRATLDASVVRGTQRDATSALGTGVRAGPYTARAEVHLRGTVIEQSAWMGMDVWGSSATVEGSVIRDSNDRGATIEADGSERSNVTFTSSVIERSHEVGIVAAGSDLRVDATVVRDSYPSAVGLGGRGIAIWPDEGQRAALHASWSLVDRSRDQGVHVSGSDATLEGVLVRDTQPNSDGDHGRGINVEGDVDSGARANVRIVTSSVLRSYSAGIAVLGSDALIDSVAVRDTQPQASNLLGGRGIIIQRQLELANAPSKATIRRSLIERSYDCGLCTIGAEAIIENTVIRDTRASALNGNFGDGIDVVYAGTTTSITQTSIERSARAGIACFGAHAQLADSISECNAIHLDGEPDVSGTPHSMVDGGGNRCGCGGDAVACKILSSQLQPPGEL